MASCRDLGPSRGSSERDKEEKIWPRKKHLTGPNKGKKIPEELVIEVSSVSLRIMDGYTTVTEKSLIEGYTNLGKTYLWIYAFVTLISTFTILAALYVVTAGLFMNLFDVTSVGAGVVSFGLFVFISLI